MATDRQVEAAARAIEFETCKGFEWTPEQFEIWWTKDNRNNNHEMRRNQAKMALEASEKAGWDDISTAPREEHKSILVTDGEWCDVVEWVDWKPGWYNGDVAVADGYYTHWMTLPSVPAKEVPSQ
jgi:hypothetical protein